MSLKPQCECWSTPETAAEREQLVDFLGSGFMEMLRVNAGHWNICIGALPYLAGSAVAGMMVLVAQCGVTEDRPASVEEQLAALDAVTALARERLQGSRFQDLDMMETAGRG
jgi:hypothetical protein